jgi:hypothetical protein
MIKLKHVLNYFFRFLLWMKHKLDDNGNENPPVRTPFCIHLVIPCLRFTPFHRWPVTPLYWMKFISHLHITCTYRILLLLLASNFPKTASTFFPQGLYICRARSASRWSELGEKRSCCCRGLWRSTKRGSSSSFNMAAFVAKQMMGSKLNAVKG